jgi:hypothetical protein
MVNNVEIALLRSTLRGMAERQTICGMEPVLTRSILALIDNVHPDPATGAIARAASRRGISREEALAKIDEALQEVRDRAEFLAET